MKNNEALKLVFHVLFLQGILLSLPHKTRMIFLTFDKIAYNHKSNVPPHPVVFPVMTAATVRKEDGAPQPPQPP